MRSTSSRMSISSRSSSTINPEAGEWMEVSWEDTTTRSLLFNCSYTAKSYVLPHPSTLTCDSGLGMYEGRWSSTSCAQSQDLYGSTAICATTVRSLSPREGALLLCDDTAGDSTCVGANDEDTGVTEDSLGYV